jgi:type I restriction enzyme, S subunit
MAGEWAPITLADVLSFSNGKASPARANGLPHPIYGSNGIIGFAEEANADPKTIVIGRVGSYCGSLYFSTKKCWVTDNAIRANALDDNDARFLFYLLQTLDLNHWRAGSGQPLLNQTILGAIPVSVPEPNEQRAITHILGTLDDKIELNRRMNETLEAMSRAIFQSWFVDFDPVRAKANGEPAHSNCRRLGLTLDLLALFPESCQDSELGEIPTGWATVLLGSLCSRVSMGPFGSDIKTDNFVEVGVPVVRGGNLTDGFVDEGFVFISEEKADQLRNANARSDDIVITHRGTLGQVGLIPKGSRYPRYVVSQSQMVLSINPNLSSPRYIFEFLCSPIGQHRLLANASQVGVPAIARPTTNVKSISIVTPCIELLRAFEMLVEPMLKRVVANTSESMTLAALRDTLLPKLISGDLRVKDAARFMAEAGA